jgi:hypothetical protein
MITVFSLSLLSFIPVVAVVGHLHGERADEA